MFFNLFKKNPDASTQSDKTTTSSSPAQTENVAVRKGEIGEYKIDIQLSQFPKEYKSISDLLIKNSKAKSGYSQIDHVVITPYGVFVIETKNYQGTVYGGKERKTWSVNGKYNMMNPFIQNYGHIQALKAIVGDIDEKIISIVSFTKRCTFKVDLDYRKISSNELIVYDVELSEFINRKVAVIKLQHREPMISGEVIENIYQDIVAANITDPDIRKSHTDKLKNDVKKYSNDSSDSSRCVVCNKVVSEKVKSYCMSNSKFNGEIYCYDHQKTI